MFGENMESYGLYEDLSLFNGDLLLEDVSEPAAVLQGQKVQDGLLVTTAAPIIEEAPPKASVHSVLSYPQNGSNEMGLADLLAGSPTQDLPDPFTPGSAWMDTKTDLLNLLTVEEQQQPMVVQLPEHQAHPLVLDTALLPGSPEAAVVPQVPVDVSSNAATLEEIQHLLGDFPLLPTGHQATVAAPDPLVFKPECTPSTVDKDILGEFVDTDFDAFLNLSTEPAPSSSMAPSMLDAPILSPVSADDVESLLSSSPPSPADSNTALSSLFSSFTDGSSFSDSSFTVQSDESCCPEVSSGSPHRPQREKVRPAPYAQATTSSSSGGGGGRKTKVDRRERKKEQNRTAALRYREKKRAEGNGLESEASVLEEKNKELRTKVDSLTREIDYLKDLMVEVYKARSKAQSKKSGGAS